MKKLVIIAGSESDKGLVSVGTQMCDMYNISYEFVIYSAHRNPRELVQYLDKVEKAGNTKAIIAVAGLAAALPGFIAAHVKLPVIGVPAPGGALNGMDALAAMVQMPKGVPVAVTGAIGSAGMENAIHFVKRMLDVKTKAK